MNHPTVSREEWITARKELLNKEMELSHLQDEVSEIERVKFWHSKAHQLHRNQRIVFFKSGPLAWDGLFAGAAQGSRASMN
jgi:predicted dithiol-disulfide oxidoreductase (DUF899 family)